jgi:hypothetical protein
LPVNRQRSRTSGSPFSTQQLESARLMRYLGGPDRDQSPTLLIPHAFGKCNGPRGCGATLATELDAILHYCDLQMTTKRGMREPGAVLGISSRNALL